MGLDTALALTWVDGIDRCDRSMWSGRSMGSIDVIDRWDRSMWSIDGIDRCDRSMASIDVIDRCDRSMGSIDDIDRYDRSMDGVDDSIDGAIDVSIDYHQWACCTVHLHKVMKAADRCMIDWWKYPTLIWSIDESSRELNDRPIKAADFGGSNIDMIGVPYILTGHVGVPVRAITRDAPSLYWSVLLDTILMTMPCSLKDTSLHFSFINSSQRRKPANATRHTASSLTSERDRVGHGLQHFYGHWFLPNLRLA